MTSRALTNFTPNQRATFMARPTPVIYSRIGPGIVRWRGGDGSVGPRCLNISVLPSPAERNCVIMPDSFYDSNQGYCLCRRLALPAAEQPRYYRPAAQNEPAAIGCDSWDGSSEHGPWGWQECLRSLLSRKHHSQPYLQFIDCKHTNKQVKACTRLDTFQSSGIIQKLLLYRHNLGLVLCLFCFVFHSFIPNESKCLIWSNYHCVVLKHQP